MGKGTGATDGWGSTEIFFPIPFLQEFGLDHPDTALAEEFLAPWVDGKCCGSVTGGVFFGVAGGE